jgi:hypothetical protein
MARHIQKRRMNGRPDICMSAVITCFGFRLWKSMSRSTTLWMQSFLHWGLIQLDGRSGRRTPARAGPSQGLIQLDRPHLAALAARAGPSSPRGGEVNYLAVSLFSPSPRGGEVNYLALRLAVPADHVDHDIGRAERVVQVDRSIRAELDHDQVWNGQPRDVVQV